MKRSHFIVASEGVQTTRAQLQKFRRETKWNGLMLEGPCADQRDAVAALVEHIRGRMGQRGEHAVWATIATLAPQNTRSGSDSWLEMPFFLNTGDGIVSTSGCKAGEVACSDSIERRGKEVRVVNLEELTLLTIAVLRRLGVPAFYGVMHIDPRLGEQLEAISQIMRFLGF